MKILNPNKNNYSDLWFFSLYVNPIYLFSLNQITLQEIFMEIHEMIFGWMTRKEECIHWVSDIESIVWHINWVCVSIVITSKSQNSLLWTVERKGEIYHMNWLCTHVLNRQFRSYIMPYYYQIFTYYKKERNKRIRISITRRQYL